MLRATPGAHGTGAKAAKRQRGCPVRVYILTMRCKTCGALFEFPTNLLSCGRVVQPDKVERDHCFRCRLARVPEGPGKKLLLALYRRKWLDVVGTSKPLPPELAEPAGGPQGR
jgi:hypothetical protein